MLGIDYDVVIEVFIGNIIKVCGKINVVFNIFKFNWVEFVLIVEFFGEVDDVGCVKIVFQVDWVVFGYFYYIVGREIGSRFRGFFGYRDVVVYVDFVVYVFCDIFDCFNICFCSGFVGMFGNEFNSKGDFVFILGFDRDISFFVFDVYFIGFLVFEGFF